MAGGVCHSTDSVTPCLDVLLVGSILLWGGTQGTVYLVPVIFSASFQSTCRRANASMARPIGCQTTLEMHMLELEQT